ncbi:MAG: hypothetical protein ACI9W4_002023 [Rhodothermales bacterium]|jgi:hypothetical protein
MAHQITTKLFELRALTRRATVLYAIATSVAVVLIPLAYRNGMPNRLIVLAPTIGYLALAAYRLVGGFQADRQLEFEERFVRFAAKRGELLGSAQSGGKLWKLSCLVQGLTRSESVVASGSELQGSLSRSLIASTRLMLPPIVRLAIPTALILAVSWTVVAYSTSLARGHFLFLAVLPCLALIGWMEARIFQSRRQLVGLLLELLEQVAEWRQSEWQAPGSSRQVLPYRHKLLYRDRILVRSQSTVDGPAAGPD